MTLVTSLFRRRLIAKTLIVGGLASCPLLLNSEVTLAQQWSNQRDMGCIYEGERRPYVFAVTSWSGAPANSTVNVLAILNRYSLPVLDYVPITPVETDERSGASGIASAIAIAPPDENIGYFRGDTAQASSFFPVVERRQFRLCLPPIFQ